MVEDNEKNAKRISVVLLTRNEVHNIEACLKSCSFADEWIVVDDGSSDGTVETARRSALEVSAGTGRRRKILVLSRLQVHGFF